ncbi:Fibrinogen-binding protein [Staphylococcus aureus]|uniref:Fibrinogen-binding protein n=1 Tax=Staphylococcus aureus TaxID=1280 RepID=A0A380E2T0_STAAU|nr:Fibrinogen-binding protein [Staphylococcus aureus]
MKKKLLVLTMSTLFATQFMNSNHAKASVTESVTKTLSYQNQELIKSFHLMKNLRIRQN